MKNAFSKWKIFVALAFGLLISFWMLYNGFADKQFVECAPGEGTHEWVDANNNGKVDLYDESDFVSNESGAYKIQSTRSALNDVSWSPWSLYWILLAVLFTFGRDFFYIIRIRLLTHKKLSWKASFFVIMIWEFASALSPGVVGGAAVAMFILNREKVPFGKATAIVIITAFMDNLFFILMIPFVFLFIDNRDLFPSEAGYSLPLMWVFWLGFFIILSVCIFLYLTLFWFPHLASKILLALFSLPVIRRWKFIAREWGKDIELAAKEFQMESAGFWIKIFLSTLASWVSRYLVINAVFNAFVELGFLDNIKILGQQFVLWIFMLISPTPGGSGVAEFAFGELLSGFTSSALLVGVLALIWRLISYFPYLFLGSIILPVWLKRTQGKKH